MSHYMRLVWLWACFLFLVIVQAFELVHERSDIELEVRGESSNYAQLVAEHATGTFRVVELALKTLDKNADTRRVLSNVFSSSAHDFLAPVNRDLQDVVETIPGIGEAFITDASGRVIVSITGIKPLKTITDQPYFKAVQENHSSAFIIAESVQSKETSKWMIPVLRRILDDQGRLLGIVGITLDIEKHFANLYASLGLPPGTPISLWDAQHKLLMRFPMIDQRIGTPSNGATFKAFTDPNQLESITTGPSEFDGQMRTRAARKVWAYPLYVVVAMAEAEYLKTWNDHLSTTLFVVSGMAVLTLVFTGLLQRGKKQRGEIEQASAKYQEQTAIFTKIIESSMTAYVTLDTDLCVLAANEKFVGLTQQNAEQLFGRHIGQVLPDETTATLLPQCLIAMQGSNQCFSLQLNISDTPHYYEVEVRRLMTSGVVISLRDVTLPHIAQLALQRREAELKAIFEAAPECIKVFDTNAKLIKINQAGLDIIEADDLTHGLATRIEYLVVPEDRLAFIQFNMRILRGESGSFEFHGIGLKGTPRWLESHAVPIRSADGVITGVLAITRELSKIRETEFKLRATLEEQQAMLNNGIVGLARIRNRRFVWVNTAFQDLLGYTHVELTGQPTRCVYGDLNTYAEIGEAYRKIALGEKWNGRIPLQHRDGNIRWFLCSGCGLEDGSSFWMLVDVSDQYAVEN